MYQGGPTVIRRVVLCALLLGLLPVAGWSATATAASTITIQGTVVASSTVGVDHVQIQFCPPATPFTCINPPVDASGTFSAVLAPDTYEVQLWNCCAPTEFRMKQTLVLAESDQWALELPELVDVDITAKKVDGNPLVGAQVPGRSDPANDAELTPDLPAFSAITSYGTVDTDTSGKATIQSLPDDEFELPVFELAEGARYRLPLKTPTKTSVDASSDTSVVAKALPVRTLSLTVQDHAGRAVAGDVWVSGPWGELTPERTLSENGTTAFRFPDGPATVTIRGGGQWFLPSSWTLSQPIEVAADSGITLTLPEPTRLRAIVRDADTSDVVEGARVEASGTADAATLSDGLAPATLSNGSYEPLKARSNADGSTEFRVFPDSDLKVNATLQGPGLYRPSPTRPVDASEDASTIVRLPRSVTVSVDIEDAEGQTPTNSRAHLRLTDEFVIPLAPGNDGRLAMTMSKGPALIQIHTGVAGIQVEREIDAQSDTVLEYQTPATNALTVRSLNEVGQPIAESRPVVRGNTMVDSDEGPVKGWFYTSGDPTDVNGLTTIAVAPTNNAEVTTYRASIRPLRVNEDRSVVLQEFLTIEGTGVPYVVFDAPDPFILEGTGTLTWQAMDAETTTVKTRKLSPFGERSPATGYLGSVQGLSEQVDVEYRRGSTVCVGAESRREGIAGPMSLMACRTRPVDDGRFTIDAKWDRVVDADAYGGSYRQASQRGATLTLRGLLVRPGVRSGSMTLLAHTGPNAGAVKLFNGTRRISREMSLQGPASDGSTFVEVPLRNWFTRLQGSAFDGNLRVVVVSDGKPVRIDGVAIPLSPSPLPLHSPLPAAQ
jgi:hypothetical protein